MQAAAVTSEEEGGSSRHPSFSNLIPTECTLSIPAHGVEGVNGIVFGEGGVQLVTSGGDGIVRVWETGSGQLVATFRSHDAALGVDIRGEYVVAG